MKKESSQEYNLLEIKIPEHAVDIFGQVIEFLQLYCTSLKFTVKNNAADFIT